MPKRTTLHVFPVDPDVNPVEEAEVLLSGQGLEIQLEQIEKGVFAVREVPPGDYRLHVEPQRDGFAPQIRPVTLRPGPNSALVSIGRRSDLSFPSADGPIYFRPREDAILAVLRGSYETSFDLSRALEELGLSTLSERERPDAPVLIALSNGLAEAEPNLLRLARMARRHGVRMDFGAVIERGQTALSGLTNRMVIRFAGHVGEDRARALTAEFGLEITRRVTFAGNAYLTERAGLPDYDSLALADKLNSLEEVLYAEPQILRSVVSDAYIPNDTLYPEQPYLPFINCDEAWDTLDDVSVALRGGSPAICIGVLDSDGVTPDHPDLTDMLTDGTAKLITSFNFQTMQPERPTDGFQDYHGTQVAGTATAAFDNTRGIAGVAPNCHLVGGRLPGGFDDLELADVLLWSAGIDAGNTDPAFPALPAQPADVIINSWGSNTPLSNIMRDCFDYLTTYGRDGRGCVVCFSIGNDGFEPFTNVRRYAAYDRTIAVGASIGPNPTSPVRSFYPDPDGNTEDLVAVADTRAFYSTYGPELDLVAPSSTSKTRGGDIDEVMSAVRVGEGSFSGLPQPPDMPPLEIEEDYDRSFGGTSHACPIVGGTAALILSANPALNWLQVRQILRETAVPIDTANTHPTGVWVDTDGDGVPDFSQWYGHGRVDVNAAVTAALAVGAVSDVVVRENLNDTGAVPSPGWHASSPDIWVRANDDPIPALPYTAAPPHQNAVRGQDNFVFCRVRNTGGAPASQVHIRAMICHFPGFEFRYPQEFIPSHRPGEALPTPLTPGTYLIGEVREDDLMPGESRIVKMTWPAALIPPQTVEVGGLDVSWHPCLLLEASPHDGEVAPPGSAIDIRRYNNICQRNIRIDDAASGARGLTGIVGGYLSGGRLKSLVVDATRVRPDVRIFLRLGAPRLMEQLVARVEAGEVISDLPPLGGDEDRKVEREDVAAITFRSAARMELRLANNRRVELQVAPNSWLRLADPPHSEGVTLARYEGQTVVALESGRSYEVPLDVAEGQLFPLAIGAPKAVGSGGELRVTQRRGDGVLSAGYSIVL